MSAPPITNSEISEVLERVADLLEAQAANRYRVGAYRAAAETIRNHEIPLAEILAQGGVEAVDALPTIGRTIAAHVAELVHRRSLSLLERLEGEVSPEQLLSTLPGIGPELALRIHHTLDVDTLEELEVAAHDGRLDGVAGFGPRRIRAIREQLAAILGRSARHRARRQSWLASHDRRDPETLPRPSVGILLEVDADYRAGAACGQLPRISPRRFNPDRKAWLPVLHSEKDGWHLSALFSNSARAHELEKTDDWVVLHYSRDGDEGQCTIVTEYRGPLKGKRVVRGRDDECHAHYADAPADTVSSEELAEAGRT